MKILTSIRNNISDYLFTRSINLHGSKMGLTLAPIFSKYHKKCIAAYQPNTKNPELLLATRHFHDDGFASYWTEQNKALADSMLKKIKALEAENRFKWDDDFIYSGDLYNDFPEVEKLFRENLNDFLEAVYGSNIKIYYGKLYKSIHDSHGSSGSQIWHRDGGPGTCTNVMFYLSEGSTENGAMETITWTASKNIFLREGAEMRARQAKREKELGRTLSKIELRDLSSNFYREEIETHYRDSHFQPTGQSGMVLAFRNNTIHKGGFPEYGHTRYVIVFHIYPSETPIPYNKYRKDGIPKTASYPKNPAF